MSRCCNHIIMSASTRDRGRDMSIRIDSEKSVFTTKRQSI